MCMLSMGRYVHAYVEYGEVCHLLQPEQYTRDAARLGRTTTDSTNDNRIKDLINRACVHIYSKH